MNGTDVGAASTLGLRFEIDRLESGNYRTAAWQVVWDAVGPAALAPARLYEGETAGTLARRENVFCIAVSAPPGALDALRRALEASPGFHRVAGKPAFLDTMEVVAEPLADAGSVSADGELDGQWPTRGLSASRRHQSLTVGAIAPPGTPPPAGPVPEYSALLGPVPEVEPPPVIDGPAVIERPAPVVAGTVPAPADRRSRPWLAFVAVGVVLLILAAALAVLGGGGGGGGGPLASRAAVEARALALLEKVNLGSFGNPTVESVTCPGEPPSTINTTFECGVRFSNGDDARLLLAFADKDGALAWCSIGSEGKFVLNLSALSGACKSDGTTSTSAPASTTTTQAPTTTTAQSAAPPTTVTTAPATTTTRPATTTTKPPTVTTTRPATTTTRPPTTTTVPIPTGAAVTTAAGRLAIDDVRITDRYPAGCRSTDPAGCLETDGNRIVVLVLHAAPGKSAEETADLITEEALGIESGVGSEIDDGSGENLLASIVRTTSTSPTVEVAYAELADENPAALTLIWPNNAPIPLHF